MIYKETMPRNRVCILRNAEYRPKSVLLKLLAKLKDKNIFSFSRKLTEMGYGIILTKEQDKKFSE